MQARVRRKKKIKAGIESSAGLESRPTGNQGGRFSFGIHRERIMVNGWGARVTSKLRGMGRGRKWCMAVGLGAASLCAADLAISAGAAASCDVTSGASCQVVGVKTTFSQAAIYWTESRHEGDRTFCYGIGTPSNC